MTDLRPEDFGETAVIEVKVFRNGLLTHQEWCESEDDAEFVMAAWQELPGTTFEVVDLSATEHREGDEEFVTADDGYDR